MIHFGEFVVGLIVPDIREVSKVIKKNKKAEIHI